MRFKYTGNKKDIAAVVIKNGDTIGIRSGGPVFQKMNATDDGLAVVSGNNLAAAAEQGFFGIAISDIAAGAFGEAQVYGYFDYARVATCTRAASTDVWASYSAGALRDMLKLMTGTGDVAASVSADQCFVRLGAGSALSVSGLWPVILGSSFASSTTQASSLGGSKTVSVSLMKVFVRSM